MPSKNSIFTLSFRYSHAVYGSWGRTAKELSFTWQRTEPKVTWRDATARRKFRQHPKQLYDLPGESLNCKITLNACTCKCGYFVNWHSENSRCRMQETQSYPSNENKVGFLDHGGAHNSFFSASFTLFNLSIQNYFWFIYKIFWVQQSWNDIHLGWITVLSRRIRWRVGHLKMQNCHVSEIW